jgi:Rod binding domain-containing protein
MDSNPAIAQTAMLAAQPAIRRPLPTADAAAADKAAKQFESMFIGQFLGSMYENIPTDGLMGGGQGEAMFRSLLIDQYAQSIEKQGGFGLAASVKAELLRHQQAAPQAGHAESEND